jgi:hypothetical protein
MRIFIRGHVGERDNFDHLKLELCIKTEQNRVCCGSCWGRPIPTEKTPLWAGAMRNVNILRPKSVFIQVEREAAQHDGQGKQHPLLFRHTLNWLT